VAKDGLANLKKVSKIDYQALLNASTKVWNEKNLATQSSQNNRRR
jgi:hypothetical protein